MQKTQDWKLVPKNLCSGGREWRAKEPTSLHLSGLRRFPYPPTLSQNVQEQALPLVRETQPVLWKGPCVMPPPLLPHWVINNLASEMARLRPNMFWASGLTCLDFLIRLATTTPGWPIKGPGGVRPIKQHGLILRSVGGDGKSQRGSPLICLTVGLRFYPGLQHWISK